MNCMSLCRLFILLALLFICLEYTNAAGIQAIEYVPSVTSFSREAFGDPYAEHYHNLHIRDIPLISRGLNASTVFLTSWNSNNDHGKFLRLLSDYNLKAVVTFPLDSRHYDDIYTMTATTKILLQYIEFLKGLRGYENNILYIRMGSIPPNNYIQQTGYAPISQFFALTAALKKATVTGTAYGSGFFNPTSFPENYNSTRAARIPFYVDLGADQDAQVLSYLQTYVNSSNVAYWGISIAQDLSGALANNAGLKNIFIRLQTDSYDNYAKVENETAQAKLIQDQFDKVALYPAAAISGVVITEFMDTWYRADHLKPVKSSDLLFLQADGSTNGLVPSDNGCPDNNPARQASCGFVFYGSDDGIMNPEWMGLVSQYFYLTSFYVSPKKSFATVANQWGGDPDIGGGSTSFRLFIVTIFALVALGLGLFGCCALTVFVCCMRRKKAMTWIEGPDDVVPGQGKSSKNLFRSTDGVRSVRHSSAVPRFFGAESLRGDKHKHNEIELNEFISHPNSSLFGPHSAENTGKLRKRVSRKMAVEIFPETGGSSGSNNPGGYLNLAGLPKVDPNSTTNSVIQLLVRCPPLVTFFSGDYESAINNRSSDKGETARSFGSIIRALSAISPSAAVPYLTSLYNLVSTRESATLRANDAFDNLNFLLDGMHEDLNNAQRRSLYKIEVEGRSSNEVGLEYWQNHINRHDSVIVHNFHGLIKCSFECKKCERTSFGFEPFGSVSLPLPPAGKDTTLQEALQTFTTVEITSRNVWNCEHCKEAYNEVSTKQSFWHLPQYLVLHMSRFTADGRKVDNSIDYPLTVDMAPYMDAFKGKGPLPFNPMYELIGTISHTGRTLSDGRYKALIKDQLSGTWYEMDDDKSIKFGFSPPTPSSTAYLLLYRSTSALYGDPSNDLIHHSLSGH